MVFYKKFLTRFGAETLRGSLLNHPCWGKICDCFLDAIKGTEAGITQFLEFAEVSEVNVEILTHPEISFEDIVHKRFHGSSKIVFSCHSWLCKVSSTQIFSFKMSVTGFEKFN